MVQHFLEIFAKGLHWIVRFCFLDLGFDFLVFSFYVPDSFDLDNLVEWARTLLVKEGERIQVGGTGWRVCHAVDTVLVHDLRNLLVQFHVFGRKLLTAAEKWVTVIKSVATYFRFFSRIEVSSWRIFRVLRMADLSGELRPVSVLHVTCSIV